MQAQVSLRLYFFFFFYNIGNRDVSEKNALLSKTK